METNVNINTKKEKRKKRRKIMLGILLGYLAITLVGYLGISYYFSSHFFDGTRINGIDSSKKTITEVKESIIEKIDSYALKIELRGGGVETIKAPDVKLSYVDDQRVDQLMEEQNQLKWILSFSDDNKHEFNAGTTYDKALVETRMKEMSCFQESNIEKPQDAYIDDNGETYEIIPEVDGNELNWDKVKEVLIAALDAGETEISLEELGCYEQPSIYQDDETLNKELEILNRFTATNITYDFKDDRLEVVDRQIVQDWLVTEGDGEYSINQDKVTAFVADLAYNYNTFGLKREFKTRRGNTITLTGGDYGWLINKSKTEEELVALIEQGFVGTIEPVYTYTAQNRGVNDIGSTYVEISIAAQRMWCIKDGNVIVDTPIVSGNPSRGDATPKGGCWAIDAKKRDAILTGEGYSTPVTYWLPFNKNVGIHDADTWRSAYGGDIYLTNGSHGCINTPYGNAEKIFKNVEIGTPVIVY